MFRDYILGTYINTTLISCLFSFLESILFITFLDSSNLQSSQRKSKSSLRSFYCSFCRSTCCFYYWKYRFAVILSSEVIRYSAGCGRPFCVLAIQPLPKFLRLLESILVLVRKSEKVGITPKFTPRHWICLWKYFSKCFYFFIRSRIISEQKPILFFFLSTMENKKPANWRGTEHNWWPLNVIRPDVCHQVKSTRALFHMTGSDRCANKLKLDRQINI